MYHGELSTPSTLGSHLILFSFVLSETLQISSYSYINAAMSFSTFADRIIWCSQ